MFIDKNWIKICKNKSYLILCNRNKNSLKLVSKRK